MVSNKALALSLCLIMISSVTAGGFNIGGLKVDEETGFWSADKGFSIQQTDISINKTGLNNGGQKITHLADGTADTDAVNLGQLKTYFGSSGQSVDIYPMLSSSEARMKKYANAGNASAMAAANVPQAYVPGRNAIGMGLGYSHGQSAVAVGLSRIAEDGDWIFKGSASVNSKGGVFGAGASYMW